MIEARHLLIEGRVQGVGYRYFAQQAALRLGVRGWVRNLPDGRVEALAEASAEALDGWVAELRAGPPSSQVTHVEQEPRPATQSLERFRITG